MKHAAFAPSAAILCSIFVVSTAFAQAKPAQVPATKAAAQTAQAPATKATAQTTAQAPAAPAKFVKPVKGVATIELIKGSPNKIGGDIVTVMKIKNTSSGAINLLKVDEYWYNKKQVVVTGDTQSYRKPFHPGEIIEITLKSPVKPDLYQPQWAFSHANGTVEVKAVKKFQ
jgi:hypothetical protein